MPVEATTHLNFRGRAREALGFYQSVFGGEVTIVRYRDLGAAQDPAQAEQVIWGQVAAPGGFRIMAYDVQPEKAWHPGENAFYVSVRGDAVDEITRYWASLSAGATILQPLAPSAWSPLYGMLTDRFGITWVMDVMTKHVAKKLDEDHGRTWLLTPQRAVVTNIELRQSSERSSSMNEHRDLETGHRTLVEPLEELSCVSFVKETEFEGARVPAGTRGTVVAVLSSGEAYMVEVDEPSHAVLTVGCDLIEPIAGASRADLIAELHVID